ncbi:MAG: DEAD/DEAH box helicase [candidate division Zixibacteria bacterium]|nr:DEAD/DEAH box helicase [candidate division Zixibacteria bacterium]
MRLADFERYGIPPRIIEHWRQRQGDILLPVQVRAIRKRLLGTPGDGSRAANLVITAPTSSGKSFCAEMAAVRALTARQKAVLLFPLKSLAEEKFAALRQTYGTLVVNCRIVTGDHSESDQAFLNGKYDLAVVIYEKFDRLLTQHLDCLGNIGLIVIDELQMVAEPGRGAVVERLLTKILSSHYRPTLLGLSAALGESGALRLCRWLGADWVEELSRPVDLLRGVAACGEVRLRSYNSGQDETEPFESFESEYGSGDYYNSGDRLAALARQIQQTSGSTLLFLKSRQETVQLAMKMAASVNWPSATKAIDLLKGEEPSFLVRSLSQTLSRGVAFHNADLSADQRRVIEQGFIDKQIRVLFATTTLAMGVNLPADTVYLETVKYASSSYGDRPLLSPITRTEFDNMTGRAGRLGMSGIPGRAIVLAESEFERDILWENYISPTGEPSLASTLPYVPFEDLLLDFIVSGLVSDQADFDRVLSQMLWGIESPCIQKVVQSDVASALNTLIQTGLLTVESSSASQWSVTPLGRAVSSSGLSYASSRHYLAKFREGYPETLFGWAALALSSPDWSLPTGILTRREQSDNYWIKQLYSRFDYSVEEVGYLLPENHRRQPLSYRTVAALKALLLMHDWSNLTKAQKLEETYQVHLGQVMALGESAAHLMTALAALIRAIDHDSNRPALLVDYAFSFQYGLPPQYREMRYALGTAFSRSDILALRHAGIESLQELGALPREELEKLIKNPVKLQHIIEKLEQHKEEVYMHSTPSTQPFGSLETAPQCLEIDGSFEGERYLIKVNGVPVRLTGKSFKYLTKLAWSRVKGESGWIYKDDIEIGFNQARYLYRMKNEITGALHSDWPVVENNRLGYYRLSLDPAKIQLNMGRLAEHPDYEIRGLIIDGNSNPAIS